MNAPGIGPYGGEDKNTVLGRGRAFAPLRPHPALWEVGRNLESCLKWRRESPLPVPRAAWAPPGEERDAGPEALAAQERCPQGAGRRARRRPRPQRGRASPSAPKGVCAPRPAPRSPTQCSLSGSLVKGQEVSERKTAQPRSPPNHRFSRHLRGPWEKEGHSSACAGTGLRGGRRHGGCTWPAPASASLGCVCAEELPDCDVPAPGPTRAAAKAARLSAGSVLTAALARA